MQTATRCARVLAAFAAVALAGSTAFADKTLEDLLVEKGVITEDDAASLDDDAGEAAVSAAPEAADPGDEVVVSANYKGLVISTRDGEFEFAFGGRLQLDAAVFAEDHTNLGDGTEVRRARIKSYGTLWSDWDYKLEVNFNPDGEVELTDAWLAYAGYDPMKLTLGHQKVPFGQQSMTSSNWQVFQERSLSDAFIDSDGQGRRRMGAVGSTWGDYFVYSGGVFSGGPNTSGSKDEDVGTGHRFVFHPIAEKTKVAAIGASIVYRDFTGASEARFRSRPESHIAGTRLVDTGLLASTQDVLMYDFEATGVFGRWHAQAEYTAARVWRGQGDRSLDFYGWYVQGGVFLTGESRNYDAKSAQYKRPMPKGEWGAWELAARYSTIDLTNADVAGGVERDVTVGLNWWTNPNVMFRFNYVYASPDPTSRVTLGGRDEHVHAFMGRAQVVF